MANYRNVIPFILGQEGGVSRNTKDSASRNPAPGTGGAHTNKGVTWGTFTGLAARLGYSPTVALFLEMPATVWGVIFKRGFWDALRLDELHHQGVADVLVDCAWGAGTHAGGVVFQQALNDIGYGVGVDGRVGDATIKAANRASGARLLAAVNVRKRHYYFSQQKNATFFGAWNRRLTALEAIAAAETNAFPWGATAAAVGLLGSAYYLYTRPASFYKIGNVTWPKQLLPGTDRRPKAGGAVRKSQNRRKRLAA